ncbi:MAG TPA: SurA N-terminal domain-containing protein [Patescibacteria group bacterium]|nr:SurA N-terminal domain-containing protein [Patescibacteria group bacterium]
MATRKTATKKTPAKKSTPAKKTVASPVKKTSSFVAPDLKLKDLILPIIVIIVVVLIGVFKNQFIVATVNGKQITRIDLIHQLEKKDGKTVLDSMVTEQLILQEADKRKITASNDEVKSEISSIEKSVSAQGQSLDMVLAQQGMTRDDLNEQVKLQVLLKKMVGPQPVSDREVQDYIDQNKDSLQQEGSTDPAKLNEQVKQSLEQQKVGEKVQTLVSSLQSKAKIDYLLKF